MTDILVHSGDNLATKIASAVSGDNVIIDAGATFDLSSPISLFNHGSSSNPIIIKSANTSSLPIGRVSSADASNMPRIRGTGASGAFQDTAGGAYWLFDGLEITDNSSVMMNWLFDLRHGGKTKLARIYCHPKETNPNWNRACFRAIWYEGSGGLTVERGDWRGFLGYDLTGTDLQTSEVLLSLSGKNVTFTNNFLSAWYGTIFTGGGSAYTPDVSATLSGTPSTTAATLSTTAGLAVGQYVRVDFRGTLTKTGHALTRTGGDTLTNADTTGPTYGLAFSLVGTGYVLHVNSISGNTWTVTNSTETGILDGLADGSYNWEAYEVVAIDTINAGTGAVTYHGVGPQAIVATPTTANTHMGWANGDNSNPADWSITGNTFWKDPAFVNYLISISYSLPQGKGIWEMKNMKRMTVDGNYFTGYPNSCFMREYNQDGSGPWSIVYDITFTNNYFKPDAGVTDVGGPAFSINMADPYFSSQPGGKIKVENNLAIIAWESIVYWEGGTDNLLVDHNTVDNPSVGASYHSLLQAGVATLSGAWTFRDNIGSYRQYGAQCFVGGGTLSDCWPSGIWSNNLVVDTLGAGVTTTTWGSGSILGPVPTVFSSVGWMDQAHYNYRLANGSTYKGAGTAGTDPGIDQTALETALGFTVSITSTPSVKLIATCI